MCYMIISGFYGFLLDRAVINAGSAEIVIKAQIIFVTDGIVDLLRGSITKLKY